VAVLLLLLFILYASLFSFLLTVFSLPESRLGLGMQPVQLRESDNVSAEAN